MSVTTTALVDVVFSVDGVVGRETFDVEVIDRPQPLIRAWVALERELIEAGLPTHGCGCCLSPKSGVRLLGLRARE